MKRSLTKMSEGQITFNERIGDHSKDTFVVKKANEAAEDLKKYGLPAELMKIQTERLNKHR